MGDRVDRVLPDQAPDQILIAGVADDELRPFGHGPGEASGEIVENDDRLADVEKAEDHVAADIAGPSGDQNAHAQPLFGPPDAESTRKSRMERLGRN